MRVLQGKAHCAREEMTDDVMCWLTDLEGDLRDKRDRSEDLDELFQLSFTEVGEVLEKVSWCLAKMAQNKLQDMRIYDILMSMLSVQDDDVKENIAWGLGELAGTGIGSLDALNALKCMLDSEVSTLRSSAAWAVGRYHHRLHLSDSESFTKLEALLNDCSELVRKSARFAIDDE